MRFFNPELSLSGRDSSQPELRAACADVWLKIKDRFQTPSSLSDTEFRIKTPDLKRKPRNPTNQTEI